MRKALIGHVAVFLLCMVMFAFSVEASVTGKVTDTDSNPVAGATVTFIDESKPDNRISDTTDSQGNYEVELPKATGVGSSIPSAFSLGQNYPNPFNPTTTIPFVLDKPGNVKLEVYNIMGQHIKTVADGYFSAGSHTAVWNARDKSGNHVGAGVYLYRLSSEGFVKLIFNSLNFRIL